MGLQAEEVCALKYPPCVEDYHRHTDTRNTDTTGIGVNCEISPVLKMVALVRSTADLVVFFHDKIQQQLRQQRAHNNSCENISRSAKEQHRKHVPRRTTSPCRFT
ncbi:hypothetical protein C0Q70_17960 [Pomacea canaliculata]|uniref:Uncharacterized protein n=1 Tax=Pomacea canaliculata TaxID=400727 RepID=A0A2T7NLW5_POMCA|nr:hypothetical protein C0Q70_17960 [Pomacea canaliculata]